MQASLRAHQLQRHGSTRVFHERRLELALHPDLVRRVLVVDLRVRVERQVHVVVDPAVVLHEPFLRHALLDLRIVRVGVEQDGRGRRGSWPGGDASNILLVAIAQRVRVTVVVDVHVDDHLPAGPRTGGKLCRAGRLFVDL